jgi:NAD-dependent SIR2 family protein deacetylase
MPNAGHVCMAQLERLGYAQLLVTQNVDRLHQKAGHKHVIDLHGRLDRVRCLDCGAFEQRASVQQRILQQNPQLKDTLGGLAPDGDAIVEDNLAAQMRAPICQQCAGVLMPDVVFFGGTVPKKRVDTVSQTLKQVDAVLVVGSSLMVYSGFRFCKQAVAFGVPIALLNKGKTRADDLATIKLESDCALTLQQTVTMLQAEGLPGIRS